MCVLKREENPWICTTNNSKQINKFAFKKGVKQKLFQLEK